jgi:RNA polymerase sigma factor (sigma-70 family)
MDMTGGSEGAMTLTPVDARGALPPPSVEVSDELLVERLRGGDAAAGETLCRRHHEPLMRYLQRLVGPQVAEELFQQTWLSVLDHIDRFNPGTGSDGPKGGAFKAWLFRIATNKANDHWRSSGRERAGKEGLRLITEIAAPHAGHRLEATEMGQKLQRALEQLPENQRQVLLLRFYSDMKFIEIAEVLGCPLNTALGRVHKAVIKLRQLMASETDNRTNT